MQKISVLNASLMAGEGVVNGFTEKMKEVFTGGYWTINPGHPNFNQELLRLTIEHQPTIVFIQTQTNGVLDPDIARQVALHSFVIQFSGDVRHDTEQFYYDIGRNIQLTTFSNMRDVRNCLAQGITADWLELGYDELKYRSWENIPNEYDVIAHFNDYIFQFSLSQYRREIVARLQGEFGDRFAVFGNFPGAKANLNSDQIAESKNYRKSHIAINCSHFEIEKYSSDRMLRILGSGVTCVSHVFPDIHSMYEVGNHLYVFNNLDEMVAVCKALLNNPDEMKKVAAAGQKYALENYSFLHMAENIKNLYLKYSK